MYNTMIHQNLLVVKEGAIRRYFMFYDRLLELCEHQGISLNKLCRDVGLSHGAPAKWRNGALPRNSTIKKIADYFNVDTAYLTGDDKNAVPDKLSLEHYTERQKRVIEAYEAHTDMQKAVDKLLDLDF